MTVAILDLRQRIKQLPGRDYISYSAISTYQQCPLKFKFRYLDQLPEDAVSAGSNTLPAPNRMICSCNPVSSPVGERPNNKRHSKQTSDDYKQPSVVVGFRRWR
jgi:hypothetical protein